MGLRQIYAACAYFLPQKRNCIKTEDFYSVFQVFTNDMYKLDQNFRIGKIKVRLIVPESAPYIYRPFRGMYFPQ